MSLQLEAVRRLSRQLRRFSNRTVLDPRSTPVTSKPAVNHALACRELRELPHQVLVETDFGIPPMTSAPISEKLIST